LESNLIKSVIKKQGQGRKASTIYPNKKKRGLASDRTWSGEEWGEKKRGIVWVRLLLRILITN